MQPAEPVVEARTHRFLTRLERQQVAAQLLEEVIWATGEPILASGAVARCAKKFNVSGPAISKFWKHMKQNLVNGILTSSPEKKPRSSSLLYCRDELMEEIASLPHWKRCTLRDMATELGVGKSTLQQMLRSKTTNEGGNYLVPHTNSLLPLLTEEHKVARVLYALSKLDRDRGCFSSFLYDVHVDEKWFELTPNRFRVYLTKNEKENDRQPIRKVIHKSHVPKIMFLAATAHPMETAFLMEQ